MWTLCCNGRFNQRRRKVMKPSIHYNVANHLGEMPELSYRIWHHCDYEMKIKSPSDFALVHDIEVESILKSVLLARKNRRKSSHSSEDFAIACLPVTERIDLKSVANTLGWSRAEIAQPAELEEMTAYPINGVSPLGLNGLRILLFDEAITEETVFIGAGIPACEIELSVTALKHLLGQPKQRSNFD